MVSKKFILLLLLAMATRSLYTSSYWAERGINVRDQVLEQ
jgi:hypothetical protein